MVLTNDNEESRKMVEQCYRRHKTNLNPIIDWTDSEVWEFIRAERIPYCELYNEGFHRLGCIGCPMSQKSGRVRDFLRWPKYKAAYLRAFAKMLEKRKLRHQEDPSRPVWRQWGTEYEATPIDVFNWWMEFDIMPNQISFDDLEEDNDDLST